MMIPTVQMAINVPNSFGLIAFFSIMSDGRLSVVTAIIKLKIVPRKAPLDKSASAIEITPKISAYIGIPRIVASITPKGLLPPSTVLIQLSGIQLCITAPIPTPIRMYGNTFLNVDTTWSFA
jgi:hypothetical protein